MTTTPNSRSAGFSKVTYIGGLERGERNLTLKSGERIAEKLKVDPISLLRRGALASAALPLALMTAESHEFEVVLQPEEEGCFSVSVPALPGCHTQGETREEAQAMAKDAIEGYLEVSAEMGDKIFGYDQS